MPLWLDIKYSNQLTSRLNLFKVKKQNPYNAAFRCIYCGDSQANKLKTRGYLYEKAGRIKFKCHNCGMQLPFDKFLDTVDSALYNEYKLECLKEIGSAAMMPKASFDADMAKFSKPRFQNFEPLKSLKRISQLKLDHPALAYVNNRKIPVSAHHKLYYAPKFFTWVNTIKPETFKDQKDEPRLVIPFIDQNGYVFGFQGRSFAKKASLRYITIMLDEEKTKVFGLDTVDLMKPTFVVEGPLDSLFIPNSLAMAGADLDIATTHNLIYVFDNEPRNQEIVNKISHIITIGGKVVIWPDSIRVKDINDMVKDLGMEPEAVHTIMKENTFQGLAAQMRLAEWRKN